MPRLPGICQECGAIYRSPLRAEDPAAAPAFEVPAACPLCGGSGAVPPDALRRLEGIRRVGGRLRDDPGALEAVEALLEQAATDEGGEPGEEERSVRRARLRSRLEDRMEGAGALADALPGFRAGEVRAVRRLLRLAAGRSEERAEGGESGEAEGADPPGSVHALLEETWRRFAPDQEDEETGPAGRARRRLAATGRNDPCPCGSGSKYKDCHWVEDLRTTR